MADGSDPLIAAVRYGLFVLAALVAPGIALLRLVRLRPEPALVLPLGLLFCSVAYDASLVLGVPWLFPALTAAVVLSAVVSARRGSPIGPAPAETGAPSLRGALVPLALLVVLFAVTQYRVNRMAKDGTFLLDLGEHQDTALHVGLSFELVAGYPPQVPGLAGVEMRYHVGSHLVRAAAARWAGIHPYDSLSRFEITLWAAGMVIALRAAALALGLGRAAVALAGFLPLAADLSFVPGLLLGSQWWAFKLGGGNLVEATFYANSITPALLLVLGALVALTRAQGEERLRWLLVAGVLTAGVAQFKVFTGAQLLLALGAAWLVRRDRTLLVLAVPAAVVLGILVLGSISPGPAPGVEVTVAAFAPTNPARTAFGLPEVHGLPHALSGLAWIALALGLRVVGLPAAWRSLSTGTSARAVAAVFALCGWLLTTFVSIRADPDVDESFYFAQASGLLLWLFATPVLASLGRRSLLLGGLLAAVALASTAEFVVRKVPQGPEVVPAPAVRAMAALREASCPGDVVLSRVRVTHVPLPVVLAGRRVALADYIGYWRQFTTLEALAARRARVREFFQAREREPAIEVARELGAGYVYVRGREPAPVEATGALTPLFVEGPERVYRIAALAPSPRCH